MASSFELLVKSLINSRSIFNSSTGKSFKYKKLECPVPKSSMAKRMPNSRNFSNV